MQRNYTVFDIIGLVKTTYKKTLPFLIEEAEAAEQAEIDTIYNPERPEIAKQLREAAPNTFMSFAMPMQSAKSKTDALRFAFDAMEMGAYNLWYVEPRFCRDGRKSRYSCNI